MATTMPPNLCIMAGMPRAGSTFMYHNLGKHPRVFAPFRKETNYFLTNHVRGADWFHSLYSDMNKEHAYGLDVSPSYFVNPESITRIKKYGAKYRIIFCVRRPSDLAVSWYRQQLTHFRDFMAFHEFLDHWVAQRGDGTVVIQMASGDIRRGVNAYREAFADQMLVYSFDAFSRDWLGILRAVERFLGLEPLPEDRYDGAVINASTRVNFRPLTWLLSRESVISLMHKTVPRPAIQTLRGWMDVLSKPVERPHADPDGDRQIQLAREVLADDDAWYDELFRTQQLQLGTGSPFSS